MARPRQQPPPTAQPQPAPADTPTGRIAALPAGELLPATAVELGAPAVPVAGAALAAAAAKALAAILAAFEVFEAKRKVQAKERLTQTLVMLYPERTEAEIDSLVREEIKRDREFQARQRERLRRDLPAALATTDPKQRAEAVQKILERERRYVQMRERAMADRAAARANHLTIREQSPSGAYWKLSDHVATHTPLCLALANQFWPWSVLTIVHPQLHPGCACYLISKQQAVADGLMAESYAPDKGTPEYGPWENDAIRRVEKIGKKLGGLSEAGVTQEEIDDHLALIFAEGAITHHVGARYALRYPKGTAKGGEYRPKRGGDSGGRSLSRRLLTDLLPHKPLTPMQKARDHYGQWQTIDGRQVFVPEARAFERKIGDKTYYSPPGSTNVYEQKAFLRAKPALAPERGAEVSDTVTKLRQQHREDAAAVARRALASPQLAGRYPADISAPSKATHGGMLDAGFLSHRNEIDTGTAGVVFHYTHPSSGAQASVTYADGIVRSVAWHPGAAPLQRAPLVRGRLPESYDEFVTDVFSQMNEVALATGHDLQIGRITSDQALSDHAGFHHWDGMIVLGRDVRPSIERAAQARAEGRDLTFQESRDLYASIQTAVHEGLHGVNPITPAEFAKPASRALEEALTEELAHEVTLKMLRRYNADDVLRWAKANPSDHKVEGSYLLYRQALGRLLAQGDVPPEKNGEVLSALKYSFDPGQRVSGVAALMTHAGEDGAHEQAVADATRALTRAGNEGESGDESVPGFRPLVARDFTGVADAERPLLIGGEVQVRQPDGTSLPATVVDSYPAGLDGSRADTRFVATVRYKDGSVERYVTPAMLASPGGHRDAIPNDQRVYIAEDAMKRRHGDGGAMISKPGHPHHPTEEGRAESERLSKIAQEISGDPTLQVHVSDWIAGEDGTRGHGLYNRSTHTVVIRPASDKLTFLHEIAHAMTRTAHGEPDGHGEPFQRTARDLYAKHISPEAAETFWNLVRPDGMMASPGGERFWIPVPAMMAADLVPVDWRIEHGYGQIVPGIGFRTTPYVPVAGGMHEKDAVRMLAHYFTGTRPEARLSKKQRDETLRDAASRWRTKMIADGWTFEPQGGGMASPGGERTLHPSAIWNTDPTITEIVTPLGQTFDTTGWMPSEDQNRMIGSVFDSIAEVHMVKDFTPTPIPVLMFPDPEAPDSEGGYGAQTDPATGKKRPIMFRLSPDSNTHEHVLAHEIGHYFDQQHFGHAEGWGSANTSPASPLAGVMNALAETRTIQHIASLIGENRMIRARVIHPDGREEERDFSLDEFQERFRYLLSSHEQFARAYAQWVGLRSGNETMIAQRVRARGGPRDLAPGQWDDAEFEPVAQALDDAFAAVGWR